MTHRNKIAKKSLYMILSRRWIPFSLQLTLILHQKKNKHPMLQKRVKLGVCEFKIIMNHSPFIFSISFIDYYFVIKQVFS